ncbi:hypothetical protein P8629_05610 [Hydrogenovibrio sp. 3SP14C1]|uniref:hypothetical protein n=1 Tax=Hydrogenovibrio sp. 3SP14C1 TaxID=3038774 RepID=UPI002416F6A5|nr:hypothetical protein [Hydrogenovibrio sp. 3SP14C1]MDG4812478.1 hypothetical protein [Hydrogenovibrio sp. 3SP14C1]
MNLNVEPAAADKQTQLLQEKLESAIGRLERASLFAKLNFQTQVLELAGRMILLPGGVQQLYALAPRLDDAGLFYGTDWAEPGALLPRLVNNTLEQGSDPLVMLECMSELRLLAIANGEYSHEGVSVEQARHFLTQVLALNLNHLFGTANEALRTRLGKLGDGIQALFQYLLDHIGFDNILGSLIDEIWRILAQRPIQVGGVKTMVTQIALTLAQGVGDIGEARLGSDRLISSLFGPTQGCIDDPGLDAYYARLEAMDFPTLQQEAYGFSRAMHDVGLVSDYHAGYLRWLLQNDQSQLIPDALGLSSTGLDVLRTYQNLIHKLIEEVIYAQTAQTVYGLAMLLERGILYAPPIAPGLWRQLNLPLSEQTESALMAAYGDAVTPRVRLLSGVISLLGQPLGVGQGNNPTCQSARAISMWSYNDPDFLMHLIAQAARFDNIQMNFEGQPINSAELAAGLASNIPLDTDPVSIVLVPHLDRVYNAMGQACVGRGEDPHRWINPEFHGWWVGREFYIAVDVASGKLKNDYVSYLEQFYRSYHPLYNGNQPVIHPQPAGIAVTDSNAQFVGWHAIALLRVGLDQNDVMRVYFYNPNNDSGQNWGDDVVVSTHGFGERFGEASLPFPELASRLYIFHDDPIQVQTDIIELPKEELDHVQDMALKSWAAERQPAEV